MATGVYATKSGGAGVDILSYPTFQPRNLYTAPPHLFSHCLSLSHSTPHSYTHTDTHTQLRLQSSFSSAGDACTTLPDPLSFSMTTHSRDTRSGDTNTAEAPSVSGSDLGSPIQETLESEYVSHSPTYSREILFSLIVELKTTCSRATKSKTTARPLAPTDRQRSVVSSIRLFMRGKGRAM